MKHSIIHTAVISVLLCGQSMCYASNQEEEKFSNESLRVKEQQKAGILEENRDYAEKSDFVKNRDRLTGTAQKTGEELKKAGENIGDTIKKLF